MVRVELVDDAGVHGVVEVAAASEHVLKCEVLLDFVLIEHAPEVGTLFIPGQGDPCSWPQHSIVVHSEEDL